MNKIITASLDLNTALTNFESIINPILSLNELDSWDGNLLLDYEEKIRSAALVLAGECTALLLNNLSKSKKIQALAIEQTKGWWHKKTKKHGYRTWNILTVGNVQVSLLLQYVVERPGKFTGTKRFSRQGFCPFLRWLGMYEGVTPLVWSLIAKYGTISSSFMAATESVLDWGANISLKRVERLTYEFNQIGVSLRQSKLFALSQGYLSSTSALKDQRVVIAVDGGRTRIRVEKKGRRNLKTNRRGFTGEWIEPKLLTIYTVDEQGRKNKASGGIIVNDGTYKNCEDFLKLLEMHLISLGINQAKQVLLIADGAEWIWKHIPPLLEKLGCPFTYQLLDFYHVAEHIYTVALAAFSTDELQNKWFNQARRLLKNGQAQTLLEHIKTLRSLANTDNGKIIDCQINYLTKGLINGRLNYALVSQLKLPIGSGAIESLIRQVVNLRMKGNGKFWLKDNAELILHARCQWFAGNWKHFCDSVITARIRPPRASA